jgi:hypothetical protein
MARTEKSEQELGIAFDLNAATRDAIGACGGNLMATIQSLVVANNYLLAENARLAEELDAAWRWISPGYARSTGRRNMKSGDQD